MKLIPNILSSLRIAFSLVLLALPEKAGTFAALYLVCGVSDMADGYIARRFEATSKLGATLDSVADFIFSLAIVSSLLYFTDVLKNSFVVASIVLILGIRVGNLIATRLKFHQWASLHTLGSKLTGIILFLVVPVCILINDFPALIVVPVVVLAFSAALEESMIIYHCKGYEVNIRNYKEACQKLL